MGIGNLSVDEIKQQFLDDLFQVVTTRINGKEKYGRQVQTRLICTNEGYNLVLNKRWSARWDNLKHVTRAEYMAQMAMFTTNNLWQFKPKGKFEWENLLSEEDTSERKQVFGYLIHALDMDVMKWEDELRLSKTFKKTKNKDGKKHAKYEYVTLPEDSYDVPYNIEESNENLIEVIASGESIHDTNKEYEKNAFLRFVDEKAKELVDPIHLERLDILARNEVNDDYGEKERVTETGLNKGHFQTSKNRFKKAILAAYENEEYKSFTQITKEKHIELLNGFLELKNLHLVSEYLRENEMKSKSFLANLFYDNLTGIYTKDFTKTLLGGEITYFTRDKCHEIALDKLERLNDWNTDHEEFNWESKEIDWEDMDKHTRYNLTTTGIAYEVKSDIIEE